MFMYTRIFFSRFLGLPSSSFVALAVFHHKLGLYDLRSSIPHIKWVHIPEQPDEQDVSRQQRDMSDN